MKEEAVEQLLALDGNIRSASWIGELALLEATDPGVDDLERTCLAPDAAVSLDECREPLLGRAAVEWVLLVPEAGRTVSLDESREPLLRRLRREAPLGKHTVAFEACTSSVAASEDGVPGKFSSVDPVVDVRDGLTPMDVLEFPKAKERRVRWKRFTALRNASSKPLRLDEGST